MFSYQFAHVWTVKTPSAVLDPGQFLRMIS